MSRLAQLRQQGFDRSYAIPFKCEWKARCSQCEALCINGIPTHEHGCPNAARARREQVVREE
jgi:hypothetical protein